MKKKILLIFGTRPEAIKMAPLVKVFRKHMNNFDTKVCVTAQHREMLDQVLTFFEIKPDYDLNLMRSGQNLYQLTAEVVVGLKSILEAFVPDIVFVHGDTTTSSAAALAAFYAGAKVAHVEAGLRTYNKQAPFPEEMNRQITSRIADYHFSPTETAKQNLLHEGIDENRIVVTGNTVIDALLWAQEKLKHYNDDEIQQLKSIIDLTKKIILVTGHRRENFGKGFLNICKAIRQVAEANTDTQIIYPVHLNPNVQKPVYELLSRQPNIQLINPLAYPAFVWLMGKAYLILTDSGGIQEEATSIGKPVLVMRETTERPEAVMAGTVKIVGTDKKKIILSITELLNNDSLYLQMNKDQNLYGNGTACLQIVNTLILQQ
ncbi:MAG: UDP-N-acetylglucosamine 2-epimerase (non-hydrolyzing) [Bacteroidales bacterium]|jgi:UDP-N-acetylglucosamine 2-epimerase (non-hydrolysing)|nr:UDP-N-acetylglucosamine 2-epimerase (non-hydrolyzing) [Bacteroidales bacterium]